MLIYPAIDLLDGRCVRLKQGGFDTRTVYSEDPQAILRGFEAAGATYLHLVDLSGAKDPERRQLDLLTRLLSASSLRIQVGGGIRDFGQAAQLLQIGADRVVIGSAAVSDPALVLKLLAEFGGAKVTVALDVRVDGSGRACVASHGWKDQSTLEIGDALKPLLGAGLERVLCTDISLDGMMKGPNLLLYAELMTRFPEVEIQASGGVSDLNDLLALRSTGVRSAIVGKALYEGAIDLAEAISRC